MIFFNINVTEWVNLGINYLEIWWVIMSVAIVLIVYSSTSHLGIAHKFPKAWIFQNLQHLQTRRKISIL